MNLLMKDPKSLTPYENNPKKHTPEQIDAIAFSIREFGFDQPVVVTPEGVIIKGHGRTLAAIQLGLNAIPVIVSDNTAQEAVLNRVMDNRAPSTEYDDLALRAELTDLKLSGHLELSLHLDTDIPLVPTKSPTSEISIFSLGTSHKCPSCQYHW